MTIARTVNKLASQLAKREGRKSQARIGDIRELLKLMIALEVAAWDEEADGVIVSDIIKGAAADKRSKRKVRK